MGIICLYVLIQKTGQKTAKSHLCAMYTKNIPSKVGYLSKTAEIFSTAKIAHKNKIHLSFHRTWDI